MNIGQYIPLTTHLVGQHEKWHCDAHLWLPAENDFLRKMNREHVGIVPAMNTGLLLTADSSPGPSSRYRRSYSRHITLTPGSPIENLQRRPTYRWSVSQSYWIRNLTCSMSVQGQYATGDRGRQGTEAAQTLPAVW